MIELAIVKQLESHVGQMLMVGIDGYELTTAELKICQSLNFGGFILFNRNCCEPAQINSLCRALATATRNLPFIAIDEEGGRVHRLPWPFTHFPPAELVGKTANPDLAFRVGLAVAAELTLLGINLNFAPVLDVNSNAANPIIGDRSFGAAPNQVAAMALAWSEGLSTGGIVPCGKHFPGHGSTDRDSHLDLPVVAKSLGELQEVEFKPFIRACKSPIEALMTAHVLFPALDRELPATLSRRIVTGVLRKELGYEGVVFSDDMEMGAIAGNFDWEEAALLAVGAGIDVLLYCHDLAKAVGIFELLCRKARQDGHLRAKINESCVRIGKLKKRCLKEHRGVPDNQVVERLLALNHRKLIDEVHGS
jgi:beta-N-acetylhexosaminidase